METEYLLCYQKEGRKPDVTGAFKGFHVSEDCDTSSWDLEQKRTILSFSLSSCFLWFLQPGSLSSSKVRRTRCSSPWSESISRLTTASPRAPWKNLPRQGRTGSDGHHNHKTANMMRLLVVEGDVPTLALHRLILAMHSREREVQTWFSRRFVEWKTAVINYLSCQQDILHVRSPQRIFFFFQM